MPEWHITDIVSQSDVLRFLAARIDKRVLLAGCCTWAALAVAGLRALHCGVCIADVMPLHPGPGWAASEGAGLCDGSRLSGCSRRLDAAFDRSLEELGLVTRDVQTITACTPTLAGLQSVCVPSCVHAGMLACMRGCDDTPPWAASLLCHSLHHAAAALTSPPPLRLTPPCSLCHHAPQGPVWHWGY